jgi:hypothetical protein
MKRSDYIAGNVEKFVTWLSTRLDHSAFNHAYTSRSTGTQWACKSLFDAYSGYYWRHRELRDFGLAAGSSYASNLLVLETLQKELRAGLAAADNERVHSAAIGVMKWGGVENGNVKWLNDRREKLCHIIGKTRDAINSGDTAHPVFAEEDLRFTSGMSKVYSLACDDFVIYDSRVAAALGSAVVQFCQQHSPEGIPEGLDFPWAPARSAPNSTNTPRRYAGQSGLIFPRLTVGRSYAEWNMLASWLLNALVEHENTRDSGFAQLESKTQQLRALEAALFMIGYDLGGDAQATVQSRPADSRQATGEQEADEWFECETGANGAQFEYRIGEDAIDTRRRDGTSAIRFSRSNINDTLRILSDHFGADPFPLANSGTGVRHGTAPFGLGTAYFRATKQNPPDTSRLGAVLEDIGVFEPCLTPPAPSTHWTLDIQSWKDRFDTEM